MHKLTLSFKDRILKIIQPSSDEIVIGRNPDCDIQIDNLAVSPVHARIRFSDEGAWIHDDAEEHHTLLNGKPVTEEMSLASGDRLTIGKHDIQYTWDSHAASINEERMHGATPDEAGNPNPLQRNGWLQFMSGPRLGKTLKLDKTYMRIGKTGKAGVMITCHDDGYYIAHLEGEMPVKVDNHEIGDKRTLLKNGDTIEIADLKMLFFTQ